MPRASSPKTTTPPGNPALARAIAQLTKERDAGAAILRYRDAIAAMLTHPQTRLQSLPRLVDRYLWALAVAGAGKRDRRALILSRLGAHDGDPADRGDP